MSQPLTLSIDMTSVAIEPSVLDGLASEYYASVLASAMPDDDHHMVVEFAPPNADIHLRAFSSALDSYRLKD